jgi:hypothetical protein
MTSRLADELGAGPRELAKLLDRALRSQASLEQAMHEQIREHCASLTSHLRPGRFLIGRWRRPTSGRPSLRARARPASSTRPSTPSPRGSRTVAAGRRRPAERRGRSTTAIHAATAGTRGELGIEVEHASSSRTRLRWVCPGDVSAVEPGRTHDRSARRIRARSRTARSRNASTRVLACDPARSPARSARHPDYRCRSTSASHRAARPTRGRTGANVVPSQRAAIEWATRTTACQVEVADRPPFRLQKS